MDNFLKEKIKKILIFAVYAIVFIYVGLICFTNLTCTNILLPGGAIIKHYCDVMP